MPDDYQDSVEMRIIQVLDKIRPFIQRDGGDCRLERFEDGIVYIKFYGACLGCSVIDTTLYDGIESILKDEIPEVVRVVNVDEDFGSYDYPNNIEDN
ncbi:MAG: NifU family protein [Gammaproteobacteria bacterium]|nr:NifU family protein [Gammaproteobacteria bacterium]